MNDTANKLIKLRGNSNHLDTIGGLSVLPACIFSVPCFVAIPTISTVVFPIAGILLILCIGIWGVTPLFREWRLKKWIEENKIYQNLLQDCLTYNENPNQTINESTYLSRSIQNLIPTNDKNEKIDTNYLYQYINNQERQKQPTRALRCIQLASDLLSYFSTGAFFKQRHKPAVRSVCVFILHIFFFIFVAPILALIKLDKKRAEKAASKKIRYDAVAKHDDGDNDAVQAQAPTLQAATSPQAQAPVSQPDSTPPAIPTTDKPTTFPRPPASPDAQQAGLHTQNNAAISSAQRAQYELTDTQQKVTSP